jgi:hypothetical protein
MCFPLVRKHALRLKTRCSLLVEVLLTKLEIFCPEFFHSDWLQYEKYHYTFYHFTRMHVRNVRGQVWRRRGPWSLAYYCHPQAVSEGIELFALWAVVFCCGENSCLRSPAIRQAFINGVSVYVTYQWAFMLSKNGINNFNSTHSTPHAKHTRNTQWHFVDEHGIFWG